MQYQIFLKIGAVCLTVLLLVVEGKEEDYYKLLGIKRTATDKEIKKAFRKLAVIYHPDKNKDPDAEAKFVEIAKAYEVLSDPEQRRLYDQLGRKQFENRGNHGSRGGTRQGSQQRGNFDYKSFFRDFDSSFSNFRNRRRSGGDNRRGNGFNFFGDDFWEGFDDDFFGSGAFESLHKNKARNHRGSHDSVFGNAFDDVTFPNMHSNIRTSHFSTTTHRHASTTGRTCRTVTQRVGNTITTYTDCS
ncbi:dnaJ homolog subfamily B member 9-like [Patiria miniata]|uniref:DnaJ homolog subfamily B member 9 n=1 Tax=Patiria miniata TaxID=46514 RepID=A0A913ZRA7_PATMI|nr:dnaJ homolog subfamily B member 9-like [Patiria miniata]